MRHSLSIYLRAAWLNGKSYWQRANRKAHKILTRGPASSSKPADRPIINLEHLDTTFDTLGVNKGDRIIVHSGISHIGKIESGPAGVMERLRERIGPQGVLLFPVFPFSTLMYTYLESHPDFDARLSPTKMGALTDIALKDPDRIRSIHPTHSVAGFGDEARAYLDEHHLDNTPFGPHSPFWRLADSGGKILVIGVGLSSVTGFHLAEDRMGDDFPVHVYTDNIYRIPCQDDAGTRVTVLTRCHDPFVSRIRDCYLMEPVFQDEGIYKKVNIGNHYAGVIDFVAMDSLLQKLAREQRVTIYGNIWG